MYKIEKKVPIPSGRRNKDGVINTIEKMEIGDSVKLQDKKQIGVWREVARRYGYKLISRTKPEYRVWLLSNSPKEHLKRSAKGS